MNRSRATILLDVRGPGGTAATVELQRCAAGRLRSAYPVDRHDVEVRIGPSARTIGAPAAPLLTELLGALVAGIESADPRCRRILIAIAPGASALCTAATAAGFRHVVDVDLPGAELSLLVAEPAWVTAVDPDLDRVPGT
ncbi:hypothetical protein [Nocardia sp. alder85J]|uniref:hypothetical protein n=1 Tax=Nocardia sp. alder85J TaxID=2862949 RepID=UPI00224EA18D|nr:hypothetical protein [Nocardia sp. alder85J]MCX4091057.1 hypothetical protein [Nocardia sp. alder85J]